MNDIIDSENLKDKHMTYFVWDQDIQDKLATNITNNIDSYIDLRHVQAKYLPCPEELIISLVSENRFALDILKKLFLVSLQVGFNELAKIILKKLITINGHLDDRWPSIAWAVRFKRYEILQELFNLGLDVNIKLEYYEYPLFYAAINNDVHTLIELIEKGANIEAQDNYGNTPLIGALLRLKVKCGDVNVISLLITKGADIEARNKNKETLLIIAAIYNVAIVVRMLIKAGVDIEAQDKYGRTALVIAAQRSHDKLIEMLLDYKAFLYKDSVLHKAASFGNVDEMNIMLANGYNINAQNEDGDTPLHYAAMNGHLQAAIALLREGADILITNNKGYSIVFTSLINGHIWMCFIMFLYHIRAMFTPLNNADVSANKTNSIVSEPILASNKFGQETRVAFEPEKDFMPNSIIRR